MAFSDEDKILIKSHEYTQYTHLRGGIKIGAMEMQFLCIFPYLLIFAENLNF